MPLGTFLVHNLCEALTSCSLFVVKYFKLHLLDERCVLIRTRLKIYSSGAWHAHARVATCGRCGGSVFGK